MDRGGHPFSCFSLVQFLGEVPQEMIVAKIAITGAFSVASRNPGHHHHRAEILVFGATVRSRAGQVLSHLHSRDYHGYNGWTFDRFTRCVDASREEFPGISIDGCLVFALDGEWGRHEARGT